MATNANELKITSESGTFEYTFTFDDCVKNGKRYLDCHIEAKFIGSNGDDTAQNFLNHLPENGVAFMFLSEDFIEAQRYTVINMSELDPYIKDINTIAFRVVKIQINSGVTNVNVKVGSNIYTQLTDALKVYSLKTSDYTYTITSYYIHLKENNGWKNGISWIKTANGWKNGIPYVKTSTGWKRG